MIEVYRKVDRIEINMLAHPVGNDLCIILFGGSAPHIGAVTLSAEDDGPVTFAFDTHKEGIVTDMVTGLLRENFHGNVVVCGGIHLDNITRQEIDVVKDLCRQMAIELCAKIKTI